jgi:hypothetical protein
MDDRFRDFVGWAPPTSLLSVGGAHPTNGFESDAPRDDAGSHEQAPSSVE